MNLTQKIVRTGLIAAIYVVITMAIAPLGYGPIQFRISEIMVLLAFIDPFYTIGLTLGCLIANIFGGLGILDIVFGSLATFISCKGIELARKYINKDNLALIVASLSPVVVNGIVIGLMLAYIENIPFYIPALQVGLSEFIIITIIGVPVFKLLKPYTKWLKIS